VVDKRTLAPSIHPTGEDPVAGDRLPSNQAEQQKHPCRQHENRQVVRERLEHLHGRDYKFSDRPVDFVQYQRYSSFLHIVGDMPDTGLDVLNQDRDSIDVALAKKFVS